MPFVATTDRLAPADPAPFRQLDGLTLTGTLDSIEVQALDRDGALASSSRRATGRVLNLG